MTVSRTPLSTPARPAGPAPSPAPPYVEVPIFFQAGDARLFGIVSLPSEGQPRTGFVILPGAGTPTSVNRNRLSVRICRELAPLGYAALRCDYHGTGESTGAIEGAFSLRHPFVGDVEAAVAALRERGVERVVLAGSCFGGRCALAAAERIEDVDAVLLLATSPLDFERGERKSTKAAASWSLFRYLREALRPRRLRGLFHKRSRSSYGKYARAKLRAMGSRDRTGPELVATGYERPFRALLERGVPIVQVFGDDDSSYAEYRAAAAGPLADALREHPGVVDVRTVPGKVHGFLTPPIQDAVLDVVVAWAREHHADAAREVEA